MNSIDFVLKRKIDIYFWEKDKNLNPESLGNIVELKNEEIKNAINDMIA